MSTSSNPSESLPSVTILVASYNRLDLLKTSVQSALDQHYPSFDLLVIDDGSDTPTQDWLRKTAAAESNLTVEFQANQGVATARQRGLELATGDFVCILDSDDELTPDALPMIMAVFIDHPETDLIYTDNVHVLDDGVQHIRCYRAFATNEAMIRATFLYPRCPFKHSGTTYRRKRALELGGYDRDLPIKIDIDLFLKFLAGGARVRHLAEAVVKFRMHGDSISKRRRDGIKVYNQLIDRYGPTLPMARTLYKGVRAFWELGKGAALALRFRMAKS